ncbi:MAG: leucine-rich repeat domain-containing protein, partial [Clostridia bacterium]|nr:leucine-rich repeat domain-containing protein [Clostridia bacterium]
VISIGDSIFSRCSSLASINIPDGVTSIGYRAFYGCSSLASINIPDSVTRIGEYAFSGCTSLEKIIIPEGMTDINNYTFYYCTSLTSVTLPKSVEIIWEDAFLDCSSITDVYYYGTQEDWDNIYIELGNEYLQNATIHFIAPTSLSNVSVTKTNENTYSYSFKMTAPEATQGTFIIALYSESKLVGLATETQTESATEYTSSGKTVTVTAVPTSYKIFFWDSLLTLKPLCDSVGGTI